MVRFSCFYAHFHSKKSKRTVQPTVEVMQKSLFDRIKDQPLKVSPTRPSLNSLLLKGQRDPQSNGGIRPSATSSSLDCVWKLEKINQSFNTDCNTRGLKKSQSLGSGLDRALDDNSTQQLTGHEVSPSNQCEGALPSGSPQLSSNALNNESIFSIGDLQVEKEGHEGHETHLPINHTSYNSPPSIIKSCSFSNIVGYSKPTSGEFSPVTPSSPRCRSFEELNVLDMKREETTINDQEIDDNNNIIKGSDAYSCVGLSKDWIVPGTDEINMVKNKWNEVPSKEFKIKRIEEWVTDLQHCGPFEEQNDPSSSSSVLKEVPKVLDGLNGTKVNIKVGLGTESAKRYISSLSASATTAQLANHGLVVIPFLCAFASLKVLNLSGNALVKITGGALPKGLHMLNLSKNNISNIEGLRDLTRLRILDLSYNRIIRIGHGLASCSSLKELYLAGNKISEVEGLHRLLKLHVLDLRFNKISTVKCLGQLAANYNSLQAISLEGNPAQKNVGDEQLKKQLQTLLPHLAYFNRQPVKGISTLKEGSDRPARYGLNSHGLDRGLRADHRTMKKPSSSLNTRGRESKSQAVVSPKRVKGGSRNSRLQQVRGTKGTTDYMNNYFDFGSELLGFKADSMRRSRSEGTLGAV